MASQSRTYDDALDHLNSLQTPYHILAQRRAAGAKPGPTHFTNTLTQLHQIGYSPSDLEPLNIIHVAGTKGKGSVCAYVNSILSQYRQSASLTTAAPLKVGLFTSPHLVSVRERIRIDGTPVSPEIFTTHFFQVWDRLGLSKEWDDNPSRPPYFRFLTLLSFHIFLNLKVNCAIYEVGVGGEYDSTNVIERPVATGISKLGIDHVDALGKTVREIAWHKAGILKAGAKGFSVPQVAEALEVVEKRAQEKGVELKVVQIDPRLESVKILPDAKFQKENASLAIALTAEVLGKLDPAYTVPEEKLPREFVDGLEKVVWRGRCETISDGEEENVTWFIDGAHTVDSLKVAASWFKGASASSSPAKQVKRVLVFNQQGRDEASELLKTLYTAATMGKDKTRFDKVVFSTNTTFKTGWKKDMENKMQDKAVIDNLTVQKEFKAVWEELEVGREDNGSVEVCGSVEEAVERVRGLGMGEEVHALVTGSLHLVGGVLGVLEGEV